MWRKSAVVVLYMRSQFQPWIYQEVFEQWGSSMLGHWLLGIAAAE